MSQDKDLQAYFTDIEDLQDVLMLSRLFPKVSHNNQSNSYSLRYLVYHLIHAGSGEKIGILLRNLAFLEQKAEQVSIYALLEDFIAALQVVPDRREIEVIYQLLESTAHALANFWPASLPAFFLQQLHNIAFQAGLSRFCDTVVLRLASQDTLWLKQVNKLDLAFAYRILSRQQSAIQALAVSSDGRYIASANDQGEIYLFDATTGAPSGRLLGHQKRIEDLAFSPHENRLVSAGWDQYVRLWNYEEGVEEACLQGHTDIVRCVAFSPDGLQIASGSADGSIRLWSVHQHNQIAILAEGLSAVRGVAFSPDRRYLASCGYNQQLFLWELSSRQLAWQLDGHAKSVWHVSFDSVGKKLASTDTAGNIFIWDIETRTELHRLGPFQQGLWSVAFSPDGRLFAAPASDWDLNAVYLWDARSFEPLGCFMGHTLNVWRSVFSLDSKTLFSCSSDRTLRAWNLVSPPPERQPDQQHKQRIRETSLSINGKKMASWSVDGAAWLWDASTLQVLYQFPTQGKKIQCVGITSDGRLAAAAVENGKVQIWDSEVGQELCELQIPQFDPTQNHVNSQALSQDNRMLAVASDERVLIWRNIHQPELPAIELTNETRSVALAFSPDAQLLASSSGNGKASVWRVSDGKLLNVLDIERETSMQALAFSPDGNTLVFGTDSRLIYVWDWASGKHFSLEGHTNMVRAIAFSPCRPWIASGGWDHTIRLWDIQEQRLLAAYITQDAVSDLQFDPSGWKLYAADYGRRPNVYQLEIVIPETNSV